MVWDSRFCSLIGLFGAVFLFVVQGSLAQRVKVQPEVVTYPGQTVMLRCLFPDPSQTELTQVSWILERASNRTNIAVFHPKFGINYPQSPVAGRVNFMIDPPPLDNPTIQITNIQMTDEGRYICEYATYPSGNEQGVTSLVLLAKPANSATTITVPAGPTPVAVARCESANGRPPATISWATAAGGGNASAPASTQNSDNTVTVHSEYWLVPTPADNGKDISCLVTHRTLATPQSFPMKLVIEYPPQVKIVGYDNNWYLGRTNVVLTCQADGNPIPTTVTWRTMSGLMPDSVQVKENKLTVLKVDETVNATFICEVRNRLGTGKDQINTAVREAPPPPSNAGVVAGAIIGSLLAILLVGALVTVLVTRNRRQQQGYRGNGKAGSAPYDSVARLFGSGGNNGNNNTPIYRGDAGLSEKTANHGLHPGGVALVESTPTAQDILLSSEMDEAERRKFDELEEEDERYDHFSAGGPILQLRPPDENLGAGYLDDDMESQRDGSVISRTAVYV